MKKEKGEGEKAAGCRVAPRPGELRIWATDLHRLALISINPYTLIP